MGFCFELDDFRVHPAISMETRSESFKIHIDHSYFPNAVNREKPWESDQHIEIEYLDLPGLIRALEYVAREHGMDLTSGRPLQMSEEFRLQEEQEALLAIIKSDATDAQVQRGQAMVKWLANQKRLDELGMHKTLE